MSEGLGLGIFTAMAQIQSLLGELRSYKPHGKKKKKRTFSIPHTNSKGRTVSRAINLMVRVTMNMFFLTFCSIFCMLASPSWSQYGCSTSRHPTITLQNAETSKGSTLVLDLSLCFLNIYLFPWLLQGSVAACSIFDFCCSMQILSCST